MNRATSATGWVRNPDGTLGWTWNPMSGCRNHTPEGLCLDGLFPCYAWKLAHTRLKPLYLANENIAGDQSPYKEAVIEHLNDPFYPRFWEEKLKQPCQRKKPAGIFLDDMSDWMGDYWPKEWTQAELQMMRDNPQHRIYTLTKQPQNLPEFSPFPDNCWVGVTATTKGRAWEADKFLDNIEAKVKFLSLEPLLDWSPADFGGSFLENDSHINWLIIGACTGNMIDMAWLGGTYPELNITPWGNKFTAQPKIEWLQEIVEAADKAGVKVFLKDNLKPLIGENLGHTFPGFAYREKLRQEMPIEVAIPERM